MNNLDYLGHYLNMKHSCEEWTKNNPSGSFEIKPYRINVYDMMPKLCYTNKEIEAFHDMIVTSEVARLVITVFDGNNVTNTILPTWRFEALKPFLNACNTLRIIDVYIDAESRETSLWAVLVNNNKTNLYKEWLNDRFGIHSSSKEFVRKENR